MKFCPYCTSEILDGICNVCHLAFCPSCERSVPVGKNFCTHCGESLRPDSSKPLPYASSSGTNEAKSLSPMGHMSHWRDFFRPSPGELKSSFEIVRSSSFIRNTPPYLATSQKVVFLFDQENSVINAFADRQQRIMLMGGLVNAQRLASAVFSLLDKGSQTSPLTKSATKQLLGSLLGALRRRGKLEPDQAENIFSAITLSGSHRPDAKEHLPVARSIAQAAQAYVIAHELGHIALGHTQSNLPWSEDVQRNQERETDSFASSTLSQAPFSEYLFMGQIATLFVLLSNHKKGSSDHLDTHPHPESRFRSAYESNPALVNKAEKRFGITGDILLEAWSEAGFNSQEQGF